MRASSTLSCDRRPTLEALETRVLLSVVSAEGLGCPNPSPAPLAGGAYAESAGIDEPAADASTALPETLTEAEGFAYFHSDGISHDMQTMSTVRERACISPGDDVDSFYFAGAAGWSGTYTITVNTVMFAVDPLLGVFDAATGPPRLPATISQAPALLTSCCPASITAHNSANPLSLP